MGKGILLAVGFVLASGGYLIFNAQRSALETKEQQGDYQYQAIARDIAKSGFDRGVSLIKRQGMDAPGSFGQVAMESGTYDLAISANLYGDFDVAVDATSGEAEHDLEGNLIYTAPLPAALSIEDDEVVINGSGSYIVSGVDKRMPSRATAAGYRPPVPGVQTTASQTSVATGGLSMNRVVGLGDSERTVDQGSVSGEFSEAYFEALYQEAMAEYGNPLLFKNIPGDGEGVVSQNLMVNSANQTGPGTPKIIRANGDLRITSAVNGYGLLIVDEGDLDIATNSFNWEGLVLIRKEKLDTLHVNISNGAQIHGGLAMWDKDGGSNSLECVPDFSIDGHSTVVQDSFKVYIEVVGAAISYGGTYEMPVTSRIHVGSQTFEPWGSYNLALTGNVNTNGRFVFSPDVTFPPGAIRIDGKSWQKKEGMSGADDSEWQVALEKNSGVVTPQLHVLADGADVPAVPGFLDQASVAEFVAEYVDDTTSPAKMDLQQNETINLFELGTLNVSSEAHDLQDLVTIVSVVKSGVAGCSPGRGISRTEFNIGGGAEVHYSSEALAKLGLLLDSVRDASDVTITQSKARSVKEGETIVIDGTLASDDQEGDTGDDGTGDRVNVCHKPHQGGGTTKSIKKKVLGKHVAHGDYAGSCQ